MPGHKLCMAFLARVYLVIHRYCKELFNSGIEPSLGFNNQLITRNTYRSMTAYVAMCQHLTLGSFFFYFLFFCSFLFLC